MVSIEQLEELLKLLRKYNVTSCDFIDLGKLTLGPVIMTKPEVRVLEAAPSSTIDPLCLCGHYKHEHDRDQGCIEACLEEECLNGPIQMPALLDAPPPEEDEVQI